MDNSKGAEAGEQSGDYSQRRRGSGPTFQGLMNQKRSTDPTQQARRQSLHEQKPQLGFVGQMWHNFTRGPSSPTK
ncbi:hypothetical protein BJ170DRAFT_685179 [Xylariales sp. AK1849]|nr:hypothetical protein BJ170DRAFT_685179 [Xylariales sp. AK1849]